MEGVDLTRALAANAFTAQGPKVLACEGATTSHRNLVVDFELIAILRTSSAELATIVIVSKDLKSNGQREPTRPFGLALNS